MQYNHAEISNSEKGKATFAKLICICIPHRQFTVKTVSIVLHKITKRETVLYGSVGHNRTRTKGITTTGQPKTIVYTW